MKKIYFLHILIISNLTASIFTDKLEIKCNSGDSNSCGVLANMYENGREVTQSFYKAKQLYEKSCIMGEALACASLGVMYEFGKGTTQNINKAKSLYKSACDDGNTIGCKNYANITNNNTTSSKNFVKDKIIDRCRKDMSEYGSSMVKACVDEDIEAVILLDKLIGTKYEHVVIRCMKQMEGYGYSMIKACVDEDIKAAKALSNY